MKLWLILVTILYKIGGFGLFAGPQGRFLFNPAHFLDSARTIVNGVGGQVLQNVLSPKNFVRGSKQLLVGMPEVAIFQAINGLCSLYLDSGNINPMVTPDINEMYFQLRTPCKSISVPIQKSTQILELEEFNINYPLVLFISGWTSTIEADSIMHMAKAFNCRGGYNFLALNASYFIDTLYTWSAFNTDALGRIVAQGLVQLYSCITGLDPANPCFGDRSLVGLQHADAKFVDVIHTNPGVLGERNTLGDIDFYVQGYESIKPGCGILGCSHMRAWRYYAESVYPGHESDFLGTRCRSLKNLENGLCNGPDVVMGLDADSNSRGTHMLSVNRDVPYGKNSLYNADLILSDCGFCNYE